MTQKKVSYNFNILKEYLMFFDENVENIAEIIAGKRKRKEEIIEGLKKGETEFSVLEKIARHFKINVYNFFSTTFKENKLLVEFKTKNPNIPLSINSYHILRSYQNLREDIACLDENNNAQSEKVYSTEDLPEEISGIYRKKFSYDVFLKEKNRTGKDIFNFLREKIEEEGIYVFKNNKTDKGHRAGLEKNVCGCIFLDGGFPPLILINCEYPTIPQIATLLHEFAHYLIGTAEIEVLENFEKNKIEKWCNKFVYHFLMTKETEKKESFFYDKKNLDLDLDYLSDTYFISKRSLMVRFRELQIIDTTEYKNFLNKPYKEQEIAKNENNTKKSKGGNWHFTKKERTSTKFLEVLSENYYEKKISQSEFAKYIGVKYDKVRSYLQ